MPSDSLGQKVFSLSPGQMLTPSTRVDGVVIIRLLFVGLSVHKLMAGLRKEDFGL